MPYSKEFDIKLWEHRVLVLKINNLNNNLKIIDYRKIKLVIKKIQEEYYLKFNIVRNFNKFHIYRL